MRVVVKAPAKVNLSLDITGTREDGYHLLKTVMQSIDLCDTVTVSDDGKEGSGITVICDEDVPTIEKNIAYKTVEAYFETVEKEIPDVVVKIKKKIPIAAGLGGASADAAAVLMALDKIFDYPLTDDEMLDLATSIGADVPFCMCGGTAVAEGIGGLISPLPDMPECYLVLCKPCNKTSTAEMYRLYDKKGSTQTVEVEDMIDAICSADLEGIGDTMGNVFEELYGDGMYADIRKIMKENNALGMGLTGSGPTYVGLFENKSDASDCVSDLKKEYDDVYLTEPLNSGCYID